MIPDSNREVIFEETKPCKLKKSLRIIHFNDVYNIEGQSAEPVGGAARFYTAVRTLAREKPSLIVFSGDAISPSACKHSIFFFGRFIYIIHLCCVPYILIVSIFTKGSHMIETLNELHIHAAAVGNHEFGEYRVQKTFKL